MRRLAVYHNARRRDQLSQVISSTEPREVLESGARARRVIVGRDALSAEVLMHTRFSLLCLSPTFCAGCFSYDTIRRRGL